MIKGGLAIGHKSNNWLEIYRCIAKRVFLLGCVALIAGCANNADFIALENIPPSKAPSTVSSKSSSSTASASSNARQEAASPAASARPTRVNEPPPADYEVQAGDTLYSISFRYSRDFRDVAAVNNIRAPYTIVPGQRIDLRPRRDSASTARGPSASSSAGGENSSGSSSGNGSAPSSAGTPAAPPRQISAAPMPEETTDSGAVSSWIWPVDGNILRTFSDGASGSKGIDIGAALGNSVKAAADGTVVYAGDGLRGYGNLIILEHAGRMLSAYAFTSAINVSEQQAVNQGDVIAEVGSRGDTPLLHFEIREEGKPVDPVRYLPQR